jgi:hypothetical protein
VIPRAACRATGGTVGPGECPAIAPVSPRQKSAYRLPSTSVSRAPSAAARKRGYGLAHSAIQCIGTPWSSEPFACS